MKEEWRPVVGYEDLYEVSNTGKVRSISREIPVNRSNDNDVENYTYHRSSKELKPYCTYKKRGVKFHLHRRVKHGMTNNPQSDEYVYIDDLIKAAFTD